MRRATDRLARAADRMTRATEQLGLTGRAVADALSAASRGAEHIVPPHDHTHDQHQQR